MEEKYVTKLEFNSLREEVKVLKKEMEESEKLLIQIDKKIDVIQEKVKNADRIDELKFNPLERRIEKLEDNEKWLKRTILGAFLGLIGEAVIIAMRLGI